MRSTRTRQFLMQSIPARQFLSILVCLILLFPLAAQERGLSVMAKAVTGKESFDVGRQYAIIIGIDKYKEWTPLKGAVAEAKAVRKVLGERYYIDEFFELYDEQATAKNIRDLLMDTIPAKLGPRDSLLVFYAGHGYTDASKTGYWIAVDGTRDVRDQSRWITNQNLRNMIGGLKAQRILILADACFSGDFLNVSRGAVPDINPAYFSRALQLTARQVLTSGASETVPDDSEFGRALLNLLERNDEPLLDPQMMHERIRRSVSSTLPLLGSISGHEDGAGFVLFLRSGNVTAPAKAAAPVTTGIAELMVRAEAGAEIFVDGVSQGKAPVLIKKLDAGRALKVSARTPTLGSTVEVTLKPGELRELSLSLSPLAGNLFVTANETGVNLWVDGADKGPLGSGLFKGLPVGSHSIELKGPGLYGKATAIVSADETTQIKASVNPVGQVDFDVPAGVPLQLSGSTVTGSRTGPGSIIQVPVGDYVLNAGGNGFMSAQTKVSVRKNETVSWKPYTGGSLEFSVGPGDTLYSIDGAGWAAAAGTLKTVAPGQYQISLKKPGYRDATATAMVELGKATKVTATLQRLAPASIQYQDFGIKLDARGPAVEALAGDDGTRSCTIAAGLPVRLAFSSPYAESLALPVIEASFAEAEKRVLDFPSGRIVLPWIPDGATVSIGSTATMALRNEGSKGFQSPPLPPGEYRISLTGSLAYAGKVTVSSEADSEPADYRSLISLSLSAERLGYQKKLSSKRVKTTSGWASLVTGAIGAVGAGAVYFLGTQAMDAYLSAADTESAAEQWKSVQLYGTMLPITAAVGGIGLGLSPVLLFGGPDPRALQRSLDQLDEALHALQMP